MSEVSLAERQEVVQLIEAAWADAQYPGDSRIAFNPESNFDEVIKINRGFRGKHWREISLETLIANRDYLSFFSLEGLHFYLPAYMIASILHYETVDVLSNNTKYTLSPPDRKEIFELQNHMSEPATEEEFQNRLADFNERIERFTHHTSKGCNSRVYGNICTLRPVCSRVRI
jgi:hypothetical protein